MNAKAERALIVIATVLLMAWLAAMVIVLGVRAIESVRDFGPPPPAEITVYYCDRDDCNERVTP